MWAYRANVQVHIRSQVVVDCGLLAGNITASHNHESASTSVYIVNDLIHHSSKGVFPTMSKLWDFPSTIWYLHKLIYSVANHLCECQCSTEHCLSMISELASFSPLTDNSTMYVQLLVWRFCWYHNSSAEVPQSFIVLSRLARLK